MSKKEKRLLPSDYLRKVKYDALDDVPKDVQRPDGLLSFPEAMSGHKRMPTKEFLVFYFESADDYALVRSYFELPSSRKLSHPKLDTAKLVSLVRDINAT